MRALILRARTLEVLRPLGVMAALLARADTAPAADLHLGSRTIRIRLADTRRRSCWPTRNWTATWPGAALGRFVAVHRLSSVPGRGMIVVRPDGYIGMRGRTVQVSELAAWLARVGA